MSAQATQSDAGSLDKFAGRTTMLLHGEEIESIDDVQKGDRVAMDRGAGLQGIVAEVVREGSTGKENADKWNHKKVKVQTPSGGVRTHLLYGGPEHSSDDVARWGLPGYSSSDGATRVRVHKLLKIEE